jgi:hypothetical protein
MSELDDVQRWIVRSLRSKRCLTRDEETTLLANRYFRATSRLSAVEQLEIYREQFWLRHTSALLDDFIGLSWVLGQSAWERLVEDYLERMPPDSWSLAELGRDLPAFVQEQHELQHRELCHDVARLDWAYASLFTAGDAPVLAPERLRSLGESEWQRARLLFTPALALLRVRYPVHELRESARAGERPTAQWPSPEPLYLVVHRSGGDVRANRVNAVPMTVLEGLVRGLPLVPACEAAALAHDIAPEELSAGVTELFQQLAGWELVSDVVL